MAIQTGGFGVQVMPQVQMADPRLLAFNPALIGQGVEQGMGLARTAQDFRIRQAQQKEWELLAPDRQAAERAVLQGKAKLTPAEVDAALAKYALEKAGATAAMPNVAPAAALKGLEIDSAAKDLKTKEGLRPITDATATAQAKAGLTAAQGAEQTAAKRVELEKQTLDNMFKDAVTSGAMKADEAKLAREALDDKLKNAKDDFERARIKERAEIEQINAYVKKLESDATIDNTFKMVQRMETMGSTIASQIDRMWKREVLMPDGSVGTLRDYFNATRDPEGTPKVDPETGETKEALQRDKVWWKPAFMEGDIKLDPENEEAIKMVRGLHKKYAVLQSKIDSVDWDVSEKKGGSSDQFTVGKVYPGKDGTRAKYLGGGKWERVP